MLRENGLEGEFSKYFFGCATGVSGRKIVRWWSRAREPVRF